MFGAHLVSLTLHEVNTVILESFHEQFVLNHNVKFRLDCVRTCLISIQVKIRCRAYYPLSVLHNEQLLHFDQFHIFLRLLICFKLIVCTIILLHLPLLLLGLYFFAKFDLLPVAYEVLCHVHVGLLYERLLLLFEVALGLPAFQGIEDSLVLTFMPFINTVKAQHDLMQDDKADD